MQGTGEFARWLFDEVRSDNSGRERNAYVLFRKHQEKKERESGIVSEEGAAEEIKQEQGVVESEGEEDVKKDETNVKKEDEEKEVKKEEEEKDVKVLTSSVRSMSL